MPRYTLPKQVAASASATADPLETRREQICASQLFRICHDLGDKPRTFNCISAQSCRSGALRLKQAIWGSGASFFDVLGLSSVGEAQNCQQV